MSCHLCTYATNSNTLLRQHIVTYHTRDFPFKCETCDVGYFWKQQLEVHRQFRHEGKRLYCNLCEKFFKDPSYFRTHMKKHDPNHVQEVYQCKICLKVFTWKKKWKDHLEKHEGKINRVMCDICGKHLTKEGLMKHKKIHAGEKTYMCDVCGKAFVDSGALQTHRRVHTKERPYRCNFCGKRFTQKSSLNTHMRFHTGENLQKCHHCLKEFVTKSLFSAHKCKAPNNLQ